MPTAVHKLVRILRESRSCRLVQSITRSRARSASSPTRTSSRAAVLGPAERQKWPGGVPGFSPRAGRAPILRGKLFAFLLSLLRHRTVRSRLNFVSLTQLLRTCCLRSVRTEARRTRCSTLHSAPSCITSWPRASSSWLTRAPSLPFIGSKRSPCSRTCHSTTGRTPLHASTELPPSWSLSELLQTPEACSISCIACCLRHTKSRQAFHLVVQLLRNCASNSSDSLIVTALVEARFCLAKRVRNTSSSSSTSQALVE